MRLLNKIVTAFLAITLISAHLVPLVYAADNQASNSPTKVSTYNIDDKGRAVRGYDPTTYFSGSTPELGHSKYLHNHNGAKWFFQNQTNLDHFKVNPEKYAPANGGYCTFGVALGKKFDGDPSVYVVKDDRVYIFLNNDIKQKFLQDEQGNISRANQNWPKIKSVPANKL